MGALCFVRGWLGFRATLRAAGVTVAVGVGVVAACVLHTASAAEASATAESSWCRVALLNPYDPPVATQGALPVSNLSKVGYVYPDDLKVRHLGGRAMVRLKVSANGEFEAADLLGLDGGPPVEAAMCDLLRRLQWSLITGESQTFVFALRFCLGTCRHVPMFPGFEDHEIVINGNP